MALILENNVYGNIKIDSNEIIGFMGNGYFNFIKKIRGNNIYYIPKENLFSTKIVDSEMSLYIKDKVNESKIKKIILDEFNLDIGYLNNKICDLSHGEKQLLKYMLSFASNKKIIIIDEPFLNMDYNLKKKIKSLLKRIIYETDKTVIICSNDSNIIYELCSKVLLLDKKYYYNKVINIFKNAELLKEYNIDIPDIIKFINLAKKKNILINYSFDIRDLIKDVYKSV